VTVFQPLSTTVFVDKPSVQSGGSNGFTVTIRNFRGTEPVPLGAIADALPSGFAYRPGSTTGATTADPEIDGGTLLWRATISGLPSVAPRESITLHFGVTAAGTPATYKDSGYAELGFNDLNGALFTNTATVAVKVFEPLVTTVAVDRPMVQVGGADGFTVRVTNTGGEPVPLDEIEDVLPAGFAYVPGSATGATAAEPVIAGEIVYWENRPQFASLFSPPSIAPGSTVTLHVDVKASITPGRYKNQAFSSPAIFAGTNGNRLESATASATVVVYQPLTTRLYADHSPVPARATDGFTIKVSNRGSEPAPLGVVDDTLPRGFSYVRGSTSGSTSDDPTIDGSRLIWDELGRGVHLGGGETFTLHFRVVAQSPGRYQDSAVMSVLYVQPNGGTLSTNTARTYVSVTAARTTRHKPPTPPKPPPGRPTNPTNPTQPTNPTRGQSASTLSLNCPATASPEQGLTITAQLSPVLAGANIAMSAAGPGVVSPQTVTTDATGTAYYNFTIGAAGTWTISAHWGGDASHLASSATCEIVVSPSVASTALSLSCPSSASSAFSLTGTLAPAPAGAPIEINYSVGSGSPTTHNVTTDANGAFTDTSPTALPGATIAVNASYAGDSTHAGSSASCTVRVLR
jgi:uncharacterized repeat protein (TIGR01451 family)